MKLLILGATGLVGSEALRQALAHPDVTEVRAPVRRPLTLEHPRLAAPVVDFADLESLRPDKTGRGDAQALEGNDDLWEADGVICALGTTLKAAGSREAFRRVDLELPLWFARRARAAGAERFALNSALGADRGSRFFYSRVKGELEAAMIKLDYPSLTLVRPGLIDGERAEVRHAERLGLALSRGLRPLLPRQWRPSPVARIAEALVQGAISAPAGRHLVQARDLA